MLTLLQRSPTSSRASKNFSDKEDCRDIYDSNRRIFRPPPAAKTGVRGHIDIVQVFFLFPTLYKINVIVCFYIQYTATLKDVQARAPPLYVCSYIQTVPVWEFGRLGLIRIDPGVPIRVLLYSTPEAMFCICVSLSRSSLFWCRDCLRRRCWLEMTFSCWSSCIRVWLTAWGQYVCVCCEGGYGLVREKVRKLIYRVKFPIKDKG